MKLLSDVWLAIEGKGKEGGFLRSRGVGDETYEPVYTCMTHVFRQREYRHPPSQRWFIVSIEHTKGACLEET